MHKSYSLVFLCSSLSVQAGQITTDGSVGAAMNLTGPNYTIPQSLGTTVGNNLFQSFGNFSLSQGDIATFTGASSLQNVISRVTGGTVSNIDGTLRSQVGSANFFFINPAGVIFGKNSKVDVPSGFYVSTAQELRFSDGTKYSATLPNGSLTSAPPEAFGFLGKTGDITIENGNLVFKEGTNVTFAGGSVTSTNSNLTIPRGNLRVYGQGDSIGAVPISGDLPVGNGSITVNGGKWEVSGNGGGNLDISGGAVNITNSAKIDNANTGDQDATGQIRIEANTLIIDSGDIETGADAKGRASDIVVNVAGDMQVGGILGSATGGQGDAGNVFVTANNLTVDGGKGFSIITSQASAGSTGDAGSVTVTVAGEMLVLNGGEVSSSTSGVGKAGTVTVNAGKLTIDSQGFTQWSTGILSQANRSSTGDAGNVNVTVAGEMLILNGGIVSSGTFSQGKAGNITLKAGKLTIDGQGNRQVFTGIASKANPGSTGNAGGVTITVGGEMLVLNGGEVASSTSAKGDAGTVTVNADKLTIDGQGNTEVFTGITSESNSGSMGDAGSVTITVAGEMLILNGGEINSSTSGPGKGGNITVNAGKLTIDGQGIFGWPIASTGILSYAGKTSTGDAGNITITVASEMFILNAAQVQSDTFSQSKGGNITVNAGKLTIDNQDSIMSTGISSKAHDTGDAGNITITIRDEMLVLQGIVSSGSYDFDNPSKSNAGNVTITVGGEMLLQGGIVSSDVWTQGKGGNITINTSKLTIEGNTLAGGVSGIFSGVSQTGDTPWHDSAGSGNITITVSGEMLVHDASIDASIDSASVTRIGNGGSITINAGKITLDGGEILSDTWGAGNGGNISINASQLTLDHTKQDNYQTITSISSSSLLFATGNAGNITITVAGEILILEGSNIFSSSSSYGGGRGGNISINANKLTIDGGRIHGDGDITVTVAGEMVILDDGKINDWWDLGRMVTINANKLTINGGAIYGKDDITVTVAGEMLIFNAGLISTGSSNGGGNIIINANKLIIDNGYINADATLSWLSYELNSGGGGITVTVAGEMLMLNGGTISSNTSAQDSGGTITVNVGKLTIDAANTKKMTGIFSNSKWGSNYWSSGGNGGRIIVTVEGEMLILNGGEIASSTFGPGNAGTVTVNAGKLTIDGQGNTSEGDFGIPLMTGINSNAYIFHGDNVGHDYYKAATGNAGNVIVTVAGEILILNGGEIASSAYAKGNAGTVTVNAGKLTIDGQGNTQLFTGINSDAYTLHDVVDAGYYTAATGNAGNVTVTVGGEMIVLNRGKVSSSTFGIGSAGSVTVNAGKLTIDGQGSQYSTGISSQATQESTGNAGSVILNVNDLMEVSIGGIITSQNNGTGNAGSVDISVGNRLNLTNGSITTSAKTGNGGPISVHAPLLVMNNGQITTSVSGDKGNGGDITISGDYLVMDTGFIQANTTAHGAKGGNIFIDELGVIGNGNTVALGGKERETYVRNSGKNVIQAAAPDGVSGSVTLSSPDAASNGGFGMVSGNRAELTVPKNPCKYRKKASLRIKGRGGLPAKILDNVLSACNKS